MACFKTTLLLLTGLVLVGSVSMASAEVDNHAVVRDTEGEIVHSTDGNCVRTQWWMGRDFCGSEYMAQQTMGQQETRTAAGLTREERTVYFKFDHAALAPEAEARLDTLVNVLKSDRTVKEARIVGYADRIGSVSYNDRLSQKRAEAVRDYLVANGYTNARVTKTRWVGKSEPSTNCPAKEKRSQLIACLHNDRRVEVEIGYFDEEKTSDAR